MECDLNLTYPPFKLNVLRTTGPRTVTNFNQGKSEYLRLLPNEFLLIDLKKITRVYEYEYSTMSMNKALNV